MTVIDLAPLNAAGIKSGDFVRRARDLSSAGNLAHNPLLGVAISIGETGFGW
jgi:hypothetical protein